MCREWRHIGVVPKIKKCPYSDEIEYFRICKSCKSNLVNLVFEF